MSRRGWLLFIALCFIWGIPYLLIRVAVRELPPAALVLYRTTPAALLLLPLALRQGQLRALLAQWHWLLIYTVVELAIPWWLLAHAEQHVSSPWQVSLIAAVPLITAVLYLALGLGQHLDARRVVGLIVGFGGVAALVGIDVQGSDPVAMAEVLVVALCYSAGALMIGHRLAGLPSYGVISASLVLTAVGYAPAGLMATPASVSGATIAAVATLAVVCTTLAFMAYFALIREVGPSRATVITYVNPLVAVLLGVVLLGEPFTLGIAVGMPLIILRLRPGHSSFAEKGERDARRPLARPRERPAGEPAGAVDDPTAASSPAAPGVSPACRGWAAPARAATRSRAARRRPRGSSRR